MRQGRLDDETRTGTGQHPPQADDHGDGCDHDESTGSRERGANNAHRGVRGLADLAANTCHQRQAQLPVVDQGEHRPLQERWRGELYRHPSPKQLHQLQHDVRQAKRHQQF